MVRYFIVLVLLIISSLSFGQSEEEARLIEHLETAQGEHYAEIVVALFKNRNAKRESDLKYVKHPQSYLTYLKVAEKQLEGSDNKALTMQLLFAKFQYFRNEGYTSQSQEQYRPLLNTEHISADDRFDVIIWFTYFYRSIKQYPAYFEMLRMKKEWRIENGIKGFEHSESADIGNVFYQMKQYQEAIKYYIQAIEDNTSEDGGLANASLTNNIGLAYRKLSNYDSAHYYFSRALDLMNKATYSKDDYSLYFRALVESNRAKLLLYEGDNYTPEPFILEAIEGGIRHNDTGIIIGGYNSLADIYIRRNEPQQALEYLNKVNIYQKDVEEPQSWRLRGRALLQLGDAAAAGRAFIRADFLIDSLDAVEKRNGLETMLLTYQTKEKEREIRDQKIRLVERDNTILQQNQIKNILQISLGVALLLISIVVLFVFYQRRTKKIIERQKLELNKALLQREVLLKEIHHRVKNNLQVISGLLHLQSIETDSEEVKELMTQGQARVDAMAVLHQLLYQSSDLKTINISSYLQELLGQLQKGYNLSDNVDVVINAEDADINVDTATALGLIVTELISNSFKYAFAEGGGKVEISFMQLPSGQYEFKISDNGKGFSKGFDYTKSNSLGLSLVTMLSDEIRADLTITGTAGVECILILSL